MSKQLRRVDIEADLKRVKPMVTAGRCCLTLPILR